MSITLICMLITTFLDSLSSTRNALMALGPAASTPVQHATQHAVKNPSHLPAALAPNTTSPYPPQQDPDVRSQDKTRHLCIRSRRDVGEASGMNNPPAMNPPFLQLTFSCATFITDGLAAMTAQTHSVSELCLRGGRIHQESISRLQLLCSIALSGGQRQQLT